MRALPAVSPRALGAGLLLGSLPLIPLRLLLPSQAGIGPFDLPIAAAGLALLFLLGSSRLRLPDPECLPLWGAALLALVPAFLAGTDLPAPITNDERSYLYQAELFREGRLAEPLSAAPEALSRRQILDDPGTGQRFSKYPPGTALALTPGILFGQPALMTALAALLDLVLLAALARRLGLSHTRLAPLFLAVSPFFLLVQTSFQSEVFTLPAALGGYLCLLRVRCSSARHPLAWALGVGACTGWVLLARPLTGAVLALSFLPGLAPAPGVLRAGGLRAALAAALAGLPFFLVLLAANKAWTGDFLAAPYDVYAHRFGPFDPSGRPVDVYGRGDFVAGLLRQGGRWSVTLFGLLGGAGLGFWGLGRLRRRDGGSGLAFAVLLPVAYAFHWYPGHWAYLGPLYCLESLGLLLLGATAVLDSLSEGWRRSFFWCALLAGAALFGVRYASVRQQALLRSAPQRAARAAAIPARAVVLLPWFADPARSERSFKLYTPSRRPRDEQPCFVREQPDPARTRDALQRLGLAARPVFRFVPGEGESGRLVPYTPGSR
ncbi:MAG: hypothetical protein ACE5H3_10880 [Planctomycetota bacterium]